MIDYNTLGNNMKARLLNYTRRISKDFSKPTQKFISDVVFGMIAAKSCKITDIGRALKESIAIKKTVERIGRNLSDFSKREALMSNYLASVKKSIGPDTMLLIDGSDVAKACSPKMEAIGSVFDASTKEYADGYWTMGAVALSEENRQPIPVYENLYPCKKQGGQGFKAEAAKCLQYLRENFDSSIPRVFDRGFDSGDVIKELAGKGEMFILRVSQNRVVTHKGQRSKTLDVARGVVCEDELAFNSKSGNRSVCRIGMTHVVLPNLNNVKLNLVVCKEFGEEPLVLYTNLSETIESISVRVVKMYLLRWRIEELYGFKKQVLRFEDFRVRSLNSIKNLDTLLTIAIGFLGMLCEDAESRTVVELISVSKRIIKVSSFLKKTKTLLHAVLDGINAVFASLKCGIAHFFEPILRNTQLCIAGFEKMG
jgi:hypothetical protein